MISSPGMQPCILADAAAGVAAATRVIISGESVPAGKASRSRVGVGMKTCAGKPGITNEATTNSMQNKATTTTLTASAWLIRLMANSFSSLNTACCHSCHEFQSQRNANTAPIARTM